MGEAERALLAAVARAVLSGDRGDLAQQLEHADAAVAQPEPLLPRPRARGRRPSAPADPLASSRRP